ncbi:unnamed protein product [Arctia plantaginis]|uniref:CHK kinase-like domain-containing protein n=1 Tax=Arctia plantaginis TaxID=874455 RepID=A0A8S0YL17_ARCPL|nr:unnamed protein product [Arctia plantaginis]
MADAETVLNKLLDRIVEEPHKSGIRSFIPLTSGGGNYTSALFKITITAKNADDLKLFAKVADVKGQLRDLMNVKLLFDTEQFVYSELGKTYEKIQDKHNVAPEYRFTFPKFYGGESVEEQETVVFEDLVSKGYSTYCRFKSIDWEHAATAVESLARFHALSFAFEKEDPVNFAKALEKLKYQIPEHDDNLRETGIKIVDDAIQVTKEEHKEAIRNLMAAVDDSTQEEVYQYKLPLSKPVLCHGDYRVSNLMFQRQNGHLKTMVLDFQTCHVGCALIDLLYLEFTGTDEEFRRENHQKFIDHYFQELTRALGRLGLDVNDVYPRELFDDELRQMLPVTLRLSIFVLPLVLVEAELAPQFGKDGDYESLAISPNHLFAERFSGIVSDCVRWGVI